jgi:prepilin-type N-terminal cleavage/methylation domain-containing protein
MTMQSFQSREGIPVKLPAEYTGHPIQGRARPLGAPPANRPARRSGPTGFVLPLHGRAGFTMVEIAICLAIVAFAMVAIMGVLPAGLSVQQTNREETLANLDGTYFLEAIRNGAKGINDLTNYVDWISVSNSSGRAPTIFTNFVSGRQIVGLLSTPAIDSRGLSLTNFVRAKVRSVSGSAVEKSAGLKDFAFGYILESEVLPFNPMPPTATNFTASGLSAVEVASRSNLWMQATNLAYNAYELRLTLRWPVRRDNTPGRERLTLRTLVSGALLRTNDLVNTTAGRLPTTLCFLEPNLFVRQ